MRRRALSGLLLLASACGSARTQCELLPPEQIAAVPALGFDGLAITSLSPERPLYVWSAAEGLYARVAHGAPRRIDHACSGGIDAQAGGGRVYVACSRAESDGGEVLLYELDEELGTRAMHDLGLAGRDGRGVSLAVEPEAVHVAFHDGSIGSHAIRLATLQAGTVLVRRVSRAGAPASGPALLSHDGHRYLAYAELVLPADAHGEATAAIMIARDDQPARAVLRTRAHDAAPTLTADAHGLVLGYREKRAGSARSELHVVRIDRASRIAGTPRAIGRANGEGPPSLHGCGTLTAALLPREYGSERFLAVNQLDRELASIGAGHQFYTSGRDFVIARGTCVRDGLLLLAADRAAPSKPGVEALAMRFQCR